MARKLNRGIILLYIICVLLSACLGQAAVPTPLVSRSPLPEITETFAPTASQPTATPYFSPVPSFTLSPTTKPIAPVNLGPAQVNWRLKSQLQDLAVSFITLQEGWVATGTQLIHTQDGGKTWQIVSDTPDSFSRLDFVSQTHGWGLGKVGLYVTVDGGKNWLQQLAGSFDVGRGIWKPEIDFVNDQVGWLVEDGRIRRTQDGGQTWQGVVVPLNGLRAGPLYSLSFTSPQRGWVMRAYCVQPACDLTLFKTQDGGANWEEVAHGGLNDKESRLPWFRSPDELFFLDDLHGWFVGAAYTPDHFTSDGGKTWKSLTGSFTGASSGPHQVHMFTLLQGVAAYWVGGFTAAVRTEDGGNTWQSIFPAPGPSSFLQFFNSEDGFGIKYTQGQALLSTTDGGISWQKVRDLSCRTQFLTLTSGWGICSFPPIQSQEALYHTVDGGQTWQEISAPINDLSDNFRFFDDQAGVIWKFSSAVYGTQDGGQSWKLVSFEGSKFPLREDQSGWLYLGGAQLYHAAPGEASWQLVMTPDITLREFVPVTDQMALATFSTAQVGLGLMRTPDGGQTWTQIDLTGLIDPRSNWSSFTFSDQQHGWLATQYGMFSTTDEGLSWDQIWPNVQK